MAARKKKKPAKKKSAPALPALRVKEPTYMVQIHDPTMLRKDLLESLREIIMFMQGYEKFRKIQEAKVATFMILKAHVKELNRLIDDKLRGHFPKGKLSPVMDEPKPIVQKEEDMAPAPESKAEANLPEQQPVLDSFEQRNELDELEGQLKDIENELRNIK